ncbi:MAG: iron-sulfur cluster assembly scaffold protein [Candidatus Aenigmatarchaeota archaeon]
MKQLLPYSKQIVEHFKRPRNMGRIENPDALGEAGNLVCGDVMRLYLNIGEKDGKKVIKDVRFETFGCIIAIANCSMLTTMIKGKTLEEVMKIKKEDLIKKLGKPLPEIKIHCSILALDALHEALYNYYLKNKLTVPKELKKEHERIKKTLKEVEHRHKDLVDMERKILEKD